MSEMNQKMNQTTFIPQKNNKDIIKNIDQHVDESYF